jgi:hypothetical protein
MHWKITAVTFSVKIQLNTKFNQNNLNTFGENKIHMEAKTSMTSHFIYLMSIQSLYVHITLHNTVQCTVMWVKKINFSRTIKKVLQSQEGNIPATRKQKTGNWICHILHKNCLLKTCYCRMIEEKIEVTGR